MCLYYSPIIPNKINVYTQKTQHTIGIRYKCHCYLDDLN